MMPGAVLEDHQDLQEGAADSADIRRKLPWQMLGTTQRELRSLRDKVCPLHASSPDVKLWTK